MSEGRWTERFSSKKTLISIITVGLLLSILVANFLLHFFQQIGDALAMTIADPDAAISFSFDWKSMFNIQWDVGIFYLFFYGVVTIIIVRFIYNMKMNYDDLNKGQHGTSEFVQVNDLKKQYKIIPAKDKEYSGTGGVIISGLQEKGKKYRLLIDEGKIHTMVIGITRSGKGETFVFPMIDVLSRAKDKPSIVLNDPKGELVGASYETLIERGYEVHVFNLMQQHMGMGFNPLQLVIDAWKKGNLSLAQQYANSITHSLYHNPNAKEPMWDNSAASLVTAIILGLTEDSVKAGKEERVTMYSVASFLSTKGSDNDEQAGTNALDEYFKARDAQNPARLAYATSNFAAGNTRASIFTTAMAKLQIFMLEPNAKLTSYTSLNLTDIGFGDKPVAVFMVTPDYDSSNHVLASIFVSQLYRVNAEKATQSAGGEMKRHVHFLLDEFGNMPTVEGMAGMVTVGAGRGFRYHLIVQAYSQIKSKYGEESEIIIGNCSNQVYILTEDKQTAEQYSALLGTKTITDVSRSGKLLSMDKSHSEAVKERPLMMPDELMNNMLEGESIVVRANKRQDNKRNKIAPKPIFNSGVTALKFRYEYLSDDFDNSKSILALPIMSKEYHDLDLNKTVFESKSSEDLYIPMIDLLKKDEYAKLKRHFLLTVSQTKDHFEYGDNDEFSKWTFLHLFSYICYELDVPLNIFERTFLTIASNYLTTDVIENWREKFKEVQHANEKNEKEQKSKESLREKIDRKQKSQQEYDEYSG